MASHTEELLNHLEQTRTALRDAVDSVPARHREQRVAPDRWSVAEVLEQLAIVERRIAGRRADALTPARTDSSAGGPAASAPSVAERQLGPFAARSGRFQR